MTKFSLGAYRQDGPTPQFREVAELTPAEYKRYHDAAIAFRRLLIRVEIQIIERNYSELVSLASYYSKLFARRRGRAAVVRPEHAGLALGRAVINWLTSFRLFLDHAATDLSRRFGKNSDELRAFKAATSDAYDRSAAYRLVSRFRNYVQHCGMPLTRAVGGIADEETRATYMKFIVERRELLESFDWNALERRDLVALPAEIDVMPLIDETMRELRKISRSVLKIDIDNAVENCGVLEEVHGRLTLDANEVPMIFEHTGSSEDTIALSTLLLPPADDLRLLRDAERSADPVALMLQPDERAEAVASSSRSSDHLDRGIAILATWLEQGGANRSFHEFVSGLIRQDRSIDPVITELTFLTAVSLNMAGAAAGTSAADILGGLITQPPEPSSESP